MQFLEHNNPRDTRIAYLVAGTFFVLAMILTNAYFWADSPDYVDSVTAYQNGVNYQFWEFGHIFWRPLGWLLWRTFFDISDPSLWRYQIFSVYQWISLLAGLGSVLLLVNILRQLGAAVGINILTVAMFIFSHAFLNFAQVGTSYVPALLFLLISLSFGISSRLNRNALYASLSGVSLAISIGFWIAFVWAVPAVILAPLLLFGISRSNFNRSGFALATFIGTSLLVFGTVVAILQIHDLSALIAWITTASHGNETTGLARVIFGISRSFVFMGDGGLEFKRFLLADSEGSPGIFTLLNTTLLRFVIFYFIGLLITGILFRSSIGRRGLLFAVVACLPLIVFAVFFDGGAVERYLPLMPAVFIAYACSLSLAKTQLVKTVLVATGLLFVISNAVSFVLWERVTLQPAVLERAATAKSLISKNGVVFLINWNDPLINFNRSYPFHELNGYGNVRFNVLVTPGLDQGKTWREEFAARVIRAWENDQEVWLSVRGLAATPEPDWRWIDGSDKNVRCEHFPAFLKELNLGEQTDNSNGFIKILRTNANQELFSRLSNSWDRAL